MRVTQRVESVAIKTGKSTSTVWRWVKAGCDLSSPASINQFLKGSHRKRNGALTVESNFEPAPDLSQIKLPPAGPRGAAGALTRLEGLEERAYVRLTRAIEHGNLFKSRRPRNSISGPVKPCGDWIWQLKPNGETLLNRSRCDRSKIFRYKLLLGCDLRSPSS
jgi:hypothetical protein